MRRGVAIDLVLDRPRENRFQLVFASLPGRGGREAGFWQTARTTTAAARPGVRIPTRRAAGQAEVRIVVDSRERYRYHFAKQAASTLRRALPVGDYGVEVDGEVVAVVERKSLPDLAGSLIDGSIATVGATCADQQRAVIGQGMMRISRATAGASWLRYPQRSRSRLRQQLDLVVVGAPPSPSLPHRLRAG